MTQGIARFSRTAFPNSARTDLAAVDVAFGRRRLHTMSA
jgi:hypothetical protein